MPETARFQMAVVHVRAPAAADPDEIAAALTRALADHPKHPMTAELSLAHDVITPSHSRPHRRHGFVAMLALGTTRPPKKLRRHVRKTVRKTLRQHYGPNATAEVRTKMTAAERAAYWCTVRGTPHRSP